MRVRVRSRVFARLREIAEAESKRNGEHTSVSDLVRSALTDYINVYDTASKLKALQNVPASRVIG